MWSSSVTQSSMEKIEIWCDTTKKPTIEKVMKGTTNTSGEPLPTALKRLTDNQNYKLKK